MYNMGDFKVHLRIRCESAVIAEAPVEAAVEAIEEESAPAPIEAEPKTPAPAGREIKSKSYGKPVQGTATRLGAGVMEKVQKAKTFQASWRKSAPCQFDNY
jgi:hypothetical protein